MIIWKLLTIFCVCIVNSQPNEEYQVVVYKPTKIIKSFHRDLFGDLYNTQIDTEEYLLDKLFCDEFEPNVILWKKRLANYNITTNSFLSSICHISLYDNEVAVTDVPFRWGESFLQQCWSQNHSNFLLPNQSKNPIFLVQIKDNKIFIGWPTSYLFYNDFRLSQRTQHSLLLIDYALRLINIKVIIL